MKALRFPQIGTLDALALADVPRPEPVAGEVLVRVEAAGLNASDIKNVLGRFPYTTLPRTPGRDFAGVVVEGPEHLVGQEVWGSGRELGFTRDGSHAEYLTLPAAGVSRKPATLSFIEAATCPVPYVTASEALVRSEVEAGTRVVVIGFGAVGRAAHDLAVARKAEVTVCVRRAEQASALRDKGIDAVELADEVPGPADVVFDTTGAWLPPSVEALAAGGRIAVIAAPADGIVAVPVLDLYRRGGTIVGVNSLLHDSVATAAMLDELRTGFESGVLPAPGAAVSRPLAEAIEVYRTFDAGTRDRYVLTA